MFSDRLLGGSSFGGRRGAWYWYNNNVPRIAQSRLRDSGPRDPRNGRMPHGGIQDAAGINGGSARNSGGVHSIAELGFTIVLAVIASKVVGVLAYGLRRRNRPTIGGACGMYRPPIGPVSAIERAIVCMRMPGLADLRQP